MCVLSSRFVVIRTRMVTNILCYWLCTLVYSAEAQLPCIGTSSGSAGGMGSTGDMDASLDTGDAGAAPYSCGGATWMTGLLNHPNRRGYAGSPYFESSTANRMVDVRSFFPQAMNDLTKITWAHAVNSNFKLDQAMISDAMMLEADVRMGVFKTTDRESYGVPIMAHPPTTTSDLSLDLFIQRVISASKSLTDVSKRKGVKLDFKDEEVVDKALQVISMHAAEIDFPLWLNADVTYGPVDSDKTKRPINSDVFIPLCNKYFPGSTLSVGWTTRYGQDDRMQSPIGTGNYSNSDIERMIEIMRRHKISQPVSFPVRAGLAANPLSHQPLLHLLEAVSKEPAYPHSISPSLTVWSAVNDPVDVDALARLIRDVGYQRVFIDVPDQLDRDLREKLVHLENSANVPGSPGAMLMMCLVFMGLSVMRLL